MRVLASAKQISTTHPSLHIGHPTLQSFTWNTILRSRAESASAAGGVYSHPPISIYLRMRRHGVHPDFHTFPFLLKSFDSPSKLESGKQIHGQSLRFGLFSDSFVLTSLINMYSSCGDFTSSRQVFDEIPHPDLPSWNSIINASIRVGLIDDALKVFDEMPERNVISWSCVINGCVKCGKYKEALALFREMQKLEGKSVRPNEFTMCSVLSACGRLGALEHGKWAHAYIDKYEMKIDVVLGTSLIDMYAKCGSIERARIVFDNLGPNKDVMTWTAMISGLANHGYGEEALQLFSEMTKHGLQPNAVTLLGVLCACVHGGLVNAGLEYFMRMHRDFGIIPSIQHYGCMVDLYARVGLVKEAWNVVKSMPMEPDVLIWGALLSGSRIHGDIETCEIALKKLVELEPTNSSAYVLLSNVLSKTGKWDEVKQVRHLMEAKGIKKVPGCSLVNIGGVIREFFVGDDSHPESREIYLMLDEIMKRLKAEGYVGNKKEVLLDLDDEGKELALTLHSEKLAVAFCLLKTSPGTSIRVVKNLRICIDCHVTMKMISRVFDREIVIRDCKRFHHFRCGSCSCKDYW